MIERDSSVGRSRRLQALAGVALATLMGLGSVGCASNDQVDELRTLYRQSQDRVVELEARLEDRDARIAMLQAGQPQAMRELERLRAERDELAALLDEARAQLAQGPTVIEKPVAVPLAPEVDSALRRLASSNPGLMEYDSQRGMVRLKSDLTFALGSADVRDAARTALGRLASVLQTSAAAPYDVKIVGHTDNVPVNSATGRQRFGDNWGLSAFRAISVMDVLREAGVAAERMEIAGRGEHHPVVPNGPRGAEPNRRVEIFLIATGDEAAMSGRTDGAGSSGSSSASAGSVRPAAPTGRQSDPVMYK